MTEMYKVKCIKTGDSTNLEEGKNYYAFKVSDNWAYISRFPREGSHMGGYQLNHFEPTDEEVEWGVVKKKIVTPTIQTPELISQELESNTVENSKDNNDSVSEKTVEVVSAVINSIEIVEPTETPIQKEMKEIPDKIENISKDTEANLKNESNVPTSENAAPSQVHKAYAVIYKMANTKVIKNPYLYVVVGNNEEVFGTAYSDENLTEYLGSTRIESLNLVRMISDTVEPSKFIKSGMPIALTYRFYFDRDEREANELAAKGKGKVEKIINEDIEATEKFEEEAENDIVVNSEINLSVPPVEHSNSDAIELLKTLQSEELSALPPEGLKEEGGKTHEDSCEESRETDSARFTEQSSEERKTENREEVEFVETLEEIDNEFNVTISDDVANESVFEASVQKEEEDSFFDSEQLSLF